MKTVHDVERYYDDFAERYDRRRDEPYHALIDDLEADLVAAVAGPRGRVLEVGCGTGRIASRLAGRVREVVGVDLSREMLRRAGPRGLEGLQADLCALPLADASFDVVFSFKVIAHVLDLEAALVEMSRVLVPGGALVFDVYNPISMRWLARRVVGARRTGSRVTEADVPTRWDVPWRIAATLPPGVEVEARRGVRVLTPAAAALGLPGVGRALARAERWATRRSWSCFVGGFVVVIARKG